MVSEAKTTENPAANGHKKNKVPPQIIRPSPSSESKEEVEETEAEVAIRLRRQSKADAAAKRLIPVVSPEKEVSQ